MKNIITVSDPSFESIIMNNFKTTKDELRKRGIEPDDKKILNETIKNLGKDSN